MTRKYSCKRSRSGKRRNTRRHHGGRGGMGGEGGVAGAGRYGSNTTTGAAQVLSQWTGITPGVIRGGKHSSPLGKHRGVPISHMPSMTRKNRKQLRAFIKSMTSF